ncbi:hypothetical protein ACFU44_22340 [Nocardia rhizosphaerihabitans]|uniref:hypothetical protein n=1 Tax=Nocardia rhizosphaerihabitans TaxID=1691570 RepID=UPI00366B6FA1
MPRARRGHTGSRPRYRGDAEIVAQISNPALRRLAQTVDGLPCSTLRQIIAVVDIIRVVEGVHTAVTDI